MKPPPLGDLQQLVMLAVARLDDAAFGSRIRRVLEDAGRRVSTPTIHVTLVRLEREGLVRSTRGEPVPGRGGRARRLFRVTPAGWRALKAARQTTDRMWRGVEVPTR